MSDKTHKNTVTIGIKRPRLTQAYITIDMPASDDVIKKVQEELGVDSLDRVPVWPENTDIPGSLDDFLPLFATFGEYQDLTTRLQGHEALSDQWIDTFHAALETELAQTADQVMIIANRIRDYTPIPDAHYNDPTLVTRTGDAPWEQPAITNDFFYAPMKLVNPYGETLPAETLVSMKEQVDEAMRHTALPWEGKCFAEYNEEYNRILYRKASSMRPDAIIVDGALWCRLTMEVRGSLTDFERGTMRELAATALYEGWGCLDESDCLVIGENSIVFNDQEGVEPVVLDVPSHQDQACEQAQAATPSLG